MNNNIKQLLPSPVSCVAYNAALLTKDASAATKRKRMLQDPKISSLIAELQDWPGPSISSHKSAQQFFHKLSFLADIGVRHDDIGIKTIIDKILTHLDPNGIPQLPTTIGIAYGGTGEKVWAWSLCDAPTVLYSLRKMGCQDPGILQATEYLAGTISDNGWHCVVSPELGSWRGPGKKADPCPYATLIMVKLLLQFGDRFQREILVGAASLLQLWQQSRTNHPYIFYMGTDFRKLKLPFIWYDILHVVEVLSQIPEIQQDSRFKEMWSIIESKQYEDHAFVPESTYQPWKDWDFGQKKISSPWLTLCVEKIRNRLGRRIE